MQNTKKGGLEIGLEIAMAVGLVALLFFIKIDIPFILIFIGLLIINHFRNIEWFCYIVTGLGAMKVVVENPQKQSRTYEVLDHFITIGGGYLETFIQVLVAAVIWVSIFIILDLIAKKLFTKKVA